MKAQPTKTILIIIMLIAAFFRLINLDNFPTGITNDELHFVLNAKAVFYRFSDMSNRWSPLSLRTIPDESSSELPFLLISPIIGPLPTNLFTARLPFVIVGLSIILFTYLITKKLSNKKIALFVAVVATLNPWLIYTSRTSFDAPISILFILIFFYTLISQKSYKILFSLIPALIFFYSYIGIKPLFPFIIILSSIFTYIFIYKKKFLKPLLILNLASLVIFSSYLTKLSGTSSSQRLSELYTPNHSQIIALTEQLRNESLQSNLTPIFVNRYTVFAKYFTDKYLNNFSPKILFSFGDPAFHVTMWQHGYFYYLDILLIILGIYFLKKKFPKLLLICAIFIILSPIPEAIRLDPNPAYSFHSSLQYPFLFILIGSGLYYLFTLTQKIKPIFIAFIFFYLYLVLSFLFTYFIRYPIYHPDAFSFHQRIVSNFLIRQVELKPKNKYMVITSEPDFALKSYLFYSNQYQPDVYDNIANQYRQGRETLNFKNITFTKNINSIDADDIDTISIIENKYYSQIPPTNNQIYINHILSKIRLFSILNSTLCQLENPNKSIKVEKLNLNLNELSNQDFCRNYLSP